MAVTQKVIYKENVTIQKECKKCKGQCYVVGDQAKTQANARKMFGILPNPCVDAEGGFSMCPAIRGLI